MFASTSLIKNLARNSNILLSSKTSLARSKTFSFSRAVTAKLMQGADSPRPSKGSMEYRRTLFDELAKAEQKVGGLAQDVIKAEERTKLQILTAPVDGVVQHLRCTRWVVW